MSDQTVIGAGAAVLAAVMTFLMPVQARRVNQALVTILIVVFCFIAALSLLEAPLAFAVAVGASLAAIVYRGVVRFVRQAVYDVTKYSRRDYWYRRIGQSLVNSRRYRSRRR